MTSSDFKPEGNEGAAKAAWAPAGGSGTGVAVLALIIACLLWGLSFPLVKALHLDQAARLPDASSEFLTAWILVARFLLAALLLAPVVIRMGKLTRLEVLQGLLLAVFGGVGIGLQVDGLAYTPASTSAFLTQAYCVLLPLWAAIQTRRMPGARVAGATLLVLLGGGILAGLRPGHLTLGRGEAETLLAAVFFAFQILSLEDKRFDANRGRPVTLVMCAGIAILFLPVALLAAPTRAALVTAGASWPAFGMVAVLSVLCTVGSFLLMNTWQKRLPATEAGLIYTTEPVFAAGYALGLPVILGGMAGVDYPNETLTLPLVMGGGLILAANIWMQWRRAPHRPAVAPAP
jgi:drug/metabolite transporter (DMT)-like permease